MPSNGSDGSDSDDDAPIRLQDAQRDIRDAYLQHDGGLFTMDCVPGAGKSTVRNHIAAEDILRRYVAGDPTPEQAVAVISFNRREAETIIPDICRRLRAIVDHDLVPVADSITQPELDALLQRVRRAPAMGTIDSILRDVLDAIATDVGFEAMPAVGNTARLTQVHDECYRTLRDDPTLAGAIERLEAAYPDDDFRDGVRDLLEQARTHCRTRQLATDAFRAELERTVDDVYAGGRPSTFEDIVAAIERLVGASVATAEFDHLDEDDRSQIVAADATLHDDWRGRVDDFCTVLDAYRQGYRREIREQGVVSHTDVAALVDAYFAGRLDATDAHRDRVKNRYRARIHSLIIDEAQDVSVIQHAALSHLVTPEATVFAAGDLRQSIYLWRDAEPTLFETAITNGRYLGIDWAVHEHRTATITYRCAPDVAHAIDAICEPALTDSERGNLGDLDVTYPGLEPARDDPSSDAGANVHVAAFDPPGGDPDSHRWVLPDTRRGEAEAVATLLAKGLADGTFTDDEGDPLGITVLFRWSSKMAAYAEAFENAGLRVQNASAKLFDCAAVEATLDVWAWLIAPADPERTCELVTESNLGLTSVAPTFERHGWDIDAVRAASDDASADTADLTDAHRSIIETLCSLRDRRDDLIRKPAAVAIDAVIDHLALRADAHDLIDGDPAQRVASLDTLVATIADWEGDDNLTPRELVALVEPFREDPFHGPRVQRTARESDDVDVEFRTVHDAKGDEDDVVVIANPGFAASKLGPQTDRLITQGAIADLAPPVITDDDA
ncbi:MAG: UvrD-helicase domain-containing protein, partial [Halorhabdus sp.]